MLLKLKKAGYLVRVVQLDLFDCDKCRVFYRRTWVRELATDFTADEYHELVRTMKGLVPVF